jgi:outer membrane murein-binding lipoprotein Lpp
VEHSGVTGDSPAVTLDNLIGLVEKAARIVDYLQKENAMLADDVKDHQAALQAAEMKAARQAAHIHTLESEVEQLRHDAHLWRWFYGKYYNSTFFNHIEREYAADGAAEHSQPGKRNEGNGDAIAA